MEDCGREIFTEGVGIKWKQMGKGRPLHQSSTGQASSYNPRWWHQTVLARWYYLAHSGLSAVSPQEKSSVHITNPLLTMRVQSRWLDIDVVHFLYLDSILVYKKNSANIQPF